MKKEKIVSCILYYVSRLRTKYKIQCTTLLLAACYLLSVTCTAQDTAAALPPLNSLFPVAKKDSVTKHYFAGVTVGYSYLLGNLAEQVYIDPKAGFVNPNGYNIGLEGAYFVSKRFGFNGLLSLSAHYVSQIGLDSLARGYQRDNNSDSSKAGASTRYNFYNLLVGPYYTFPFKNKKTNIDVRLLGGLTYVRTAELDMKIINSGVPQAFAQNISPGVALATQGGIALRQSMGKDVCIKISADFYYSDPNIKINNSNFPTGVREITNYHQPVFTLHFNFGIYYKFGL